MNQAPDLDVVMVNYNSGAVLAQNIKQLVFVADKQINIYLVDNHSTDDSMGFLDDLPVTINVTRNVTNLGFAKACNQGAELGQAPYIAFINPDCFISQQQLTQLASQLAGHESAAMIGCRVLNSDGSLQAASRRRLPTFWRIVWHLTKLSRWSFFKGININDSGEFNEVQTVEAVNGACMLIKRDVFATLDGFDEAYPLHFEDLDLFARIKASQHTLIYDPSVTVTHLQGHSEQDNQQVQKWKKQGLLRYLSKHRSRIEFRLAQFILGLK